MDTHVWCIVAFFTVRGDEEPPVADEEAVTVATAVTSVAMTTTGGGVDEAATTQNECPRGNTRTAESQLTSVEFAGDFAPCTVVRWKEERLAVAPERPRMTWPVPW